MGATLQLVVTLIGVGVSALTGFSIIVMLVRSDRKQARADGRRDELLNQHTAQFLSIGQRLNVHSTRLTSLERTRFMTIEEHTDKCKSTQDEIDRRVVENHSNLEGIRKTIEQAEQRRQEYREEDNKWRTNVEKLLAVVCEKLKTGEKT